MRTAYSSRAAAYEKKGEYEKALADHKMAVLFYAIEAEILNALESPERSKFLVESARAYRARANCLEMLARAKEAASDRKRADGLEADATKLENSGARDQEKTAAVTLRVVNAWNQPVTLVVAGATHHLQIGEQKTIPAPSGKVAYEMEAGSHRLAGTLEAGRTYTIRPTQNAE
jgi:tetratricopeptide (TPR) repeat protein